MIFFFCQHFWSNKQLLVLITFHLKSQIWSLTCQLRSYGRIVGLVSLWTTIYKIKHVQELGKTLLCICTNYFYIPKFCLEQFCSSTAHSYALHFSQEFAWYFHGRVHWNSCGTIVYPFLAHKMILVKINGLPIFHSWISNLSLKVKHWIYHPHFHFCLTSDWYNEWLEFCLLKQKNSISFDNYISNEIGIVINYFRTETYLLITHTKISHKS